MKTLGRIMNRALPLALLCLATLATARTAQAQAGCADSPENPTLVLAALATGAYAVTNLRARFRR